jgi:hypothetical protein
MDLQSLFAAHNGDRENWSLLLDGSRFIVFLVDWRDGKRYIHKMLLFFGLKLNGR